MRTLLRSYGDSCRVTLSPARTRMRLRLSRPARCASTTRSCSSCTLNNPLGNFSRTVPVTSILSSLLIPPLESCSPSARYHFHIGGLQTLRSAGHFELHASALIQRLVPVRLDG